MTITEAQTKGAYLVLQVRSQDRSYGTRVPSSTVDKGKGVCKAHAVSALLRGDPSLKAGSNPKEASPKVRKEHKEYGTHNGSEHTHDFLIEGVDIEQIAELAQYLDQGANLIQGFEGNNWDGLMDITTHKNETERLDAELDKKFLSLYGERLSKEQTLELVRAKSKNSFTYVRTQVVIMVYSKTELPGFIAPKKDDGYWWTCIKSKYVYTESRIPLQNLIQCWNRAIKGNIPKKRSPKVELQQFVTMLDGVSKFASLRHQARKLGYSTSSLVHRSQ